MSLPRRLALPALGAALGAIAALAGDAPLEPEQHRVVAYFDWDRYPEMKAVRFGAPSNEVAQKLWVHPQELRAAGLSLEDVCSTERWYDLAFGAARRIGFDALAWETMPNHDPRVRPNAAALAALRRHGLKVAPLLDWEIGHTRVADLAGAYLTPDERSAAGLLDILDAAVGYVPRDLRLDESGRPILFVFSYGFPSSNGAPWDGFFAALRAGFRKQLGADPIVYWTRSDAPGFVAALIHESDWIRPFTFLSGGIHGPGSVTTSLWFDSRGAAMRDGVTRIVRDDPRMAIEVRALLDARRPPLLFHYGLNEMLEGADLLPLHPEGARRAEALRALLARPEGTNAGLIPDVTFVVDDLCHGEGSAPWADAERRLLTVDLPALLPFHRIVTLSAALEAPPRGRVLVLAERGAMMRASLPEGAVIAPSPLRLSTIESACSRAWGLEARDTIIFGQPEKTVEEAVSYEPGRPPHHAHHVARTFLPAARP